VSCSEERDMAEQILLALNFYSKLCSSTRSTALDQDHILDLANTSLGLDGRSISSSSSSGIALERAKNRSIRALKRRAAGVCIRRASVLDSSLALSGAAARRSKDAAFVLQHGSLDVVEDVTLRQNLSARGAVVEGVAGVVLPQVVHGVEDGVAADLGRAAAGVVDVVALQGDLVVGAGGVQGPVMVTIASRGILGLAIKFVVGECDAVRCSFTEDDHLAADHGELAVICERSVSELASRGTYGVRLTNPDLIRSGNCDGVTTPDVLRVEVRDMDVLDNHVLRAVGDTKTLTTEDTFASDACFC
jgi:hypothetical protein